MAKQYKPKAQQWRVRILNTVGTEPEQVLFSGGKAAAEKQFEKAVAQHGQTHSVFLETRGAVPRIWSAFLGKYV